MILLALLLSAAANRIALLDEVVTVPAAQWRALDLHLKQQGATLDCAYKVRSGSGVRLALMSVEDARRFEQGRSHRPLASTPFQRAGRFQAAIPIPGEYRLVLDNRLEGRGPAVLEVRAELTFGEALGVRTLSPARRAAVVAASALFLAVVGAYSWRRLRGWLKRAAS